MSVTMSLYKVNPDVEYVGYYLDFAPNEAFVLCDDGLYALEKYEKELGAPMREDGHWPDSVEDNELYWNHKNWEDEQKKNAWSDKQEHDKIDVTHLTACFKNYRGWNRLVKRLNSLPTKTFNNGKFIQKYIPVDEVQYAQGWFFTKRFFNKEITWVICTTKKQMEDFFNRYIDFNNHDNRGREAVDRFLTAWEDGMVFECCW